MMADDDGGVSAIAKGLLMGRTATASSRQEVAEANEARLVRLQEEERKRKIAHTLSQANPLDPNARMTTFGELLSMGELDIAEQWLKLDKDMEGRSFEDQARVVRRDIMASLNENPSPEAMMQAAARFTAAGMTGDAQEVRLQADSLQAIEEYRGALEWRNLGGKHIAVDREGNVVMEFDTTMTPAERAAYALQVEQLARAEAQGATADYLKYMNEIGDDFRIDVRPVRTVAEFYRNAMNAGDNPVGDQTLIVSINKLLDPEGVVREGEFDRVARAGGFYDKLKGIVDKTVEGRIPPRIRAQVIEEIQSLATEARSMFEEQVLPIYVTRSTIAGVAPEHVL
jgi:hypothetical protein